MGVGLRRRFGFQHGAAHRLRGRGPRRARAATEHSAILEAEIERPRVGPDARHRRHHPARAGRHRPRRAVPVGLRAGRAGHRQDRRRPAPGGVPALRAPRAADPPGRAGRRARTPASCATSATCCRRSARSTRRSPRSSELVGRTLRGLNPRWAVRGEDDRRRGDAQGRRADGRGAAPGALVARARARRGAGRAARRAAVAGRGVRGRGARRRRCARAACGTAPARAMLPQSLAHRVLVQMELAGDSPDDRVQNAVARSKPVKDYADGALAGGRPGPAGVAAAVGRRTSWRPRAEGSSTPTSRRCCCGPRPPREPRRRRAWSLADAVLVDEAADLVERTPSPRRTSSPTRRRTSPR